METMLVKSEAGSRIDRSMSDDGKLLEEIEAISKALYLDRNASRGSDSVGGGRSRSVRKTHLLDSKSKNKREKEDQAQKDKKSIWNWKPLKAFSNRNRRFNCCFTLQVHNIDNLPSSFENQSLTVHWKRRDSGLVTRSAMVFQGMAEFEERLMHSCSVYGSCGGPHHSAKYDAKHFLLYAVITSSPEVDLGKHRVDLTRLLPLTLEELEEDKISGKWTTSFRLSGKGKGAMLNVSFGYLVLGDNGKIPGINQNLGESLRQVSVGSQGEGLNPIRRTESLPNMFSRPQSCNTSPMVDKVKDLHEVLPDRMSNLAGSVDIPSQKFEETKTYSNLDGKPELEDFTRGYKTETIKSTHSQPWVSDDGETDVDDFSVIEQHVTPLTDMQTSADISVSESCDVEVDEALDPVIVRGSESVVVLAGTSDSDIAVKEDELISKEALMRDLESALQNVANLESDLLDSPEEDAGLTPMEGDSTPSFRRKERPLSFDDAIDSVASDFLNLLGMENGLSVESEPESPRERLLRQFEEDARANGCSLFDFGIGIDGSAGTESLWENQSENLTLLPVIQVPEEENQRGSRSRTKAKLLENLETEALMREWGLNENTFECSPPSSSGAFGSPVHFPSEELAELPTLGEGIGQYLQTKTGGFLRLMSPSLFKDAKSGGRLIMQASSPVVVPAEMGSGVMAILNHLASIGIEKLSAQANRLMPIEDITGKTMQQVAWEASASLEGPERSLRRTSFGTGGSFKSRSDISGAEYMSLADLAPLAMDKIEALSIEGLRIQSGMSNEEAPSNIHAESIGEFSALRGTSVDLHSGSLGLKGTGGLQLLDIKDGIDDEDGLMGLSLSLEEWMKLDSGEIYEGDQITERTSRVLAAHHANSLDYVGGCSKWERRCAKSRKCGLLGNNFTVALMVQLRDPLRDHEPVGTPMLVALIQVERVFVPPKPIIFRKVSEVRWENDDVKNMPSLVVKEDSKEVDVPMVVVDEVIPQFQITELHVAGLRTDPGKKKLWGTSNQLQSGSRWLLANGMGKTNKNNFTNPKPKPAGPKFTIPTTTTLWSISDRVLSSGNKWKELSPLNLHRRNPNILLPTETIIKLL